MSKQEHKNEYSYSLYDVTIAAFELKNGDKIDYDTDPKFDYVVNLKHGFNTESSMIRVYCTFKFIDNEIVYGTITTVCSFKIKDLDKYVNEKKKTGLPEDFANQLNAITVSTARGVSFSEFRGTFLHNAVFPLIDVTKLDKNK